MITPHAMFIASMLGAIAGIGLIGVGAWWMAIDFFIGSRQKRQFDRIKNARVTSCEVRDIRPVFLGRFRSFRGAQLAYVELQKEGVTIQIKRPLILGRNWEKPHDTLQRVAVGTPLELLEDDRGVVALRAE